MSVYEGIFKQQRQVWALHMHVHLPGDETAQILELAHCRRHLGVLAAASVMQFGQDLACMACRSATSAVASDLLADSMSRQLTFRADSQQRVPIFCTDPASLRYRWTGVRPAQQRSIAPDEHTLHLPLRSLGGCNEDTTANCLRFHQLSWL